MTDGKLSRSIDDIVASARMYYKENLNQAEIARRLGVSRPTVSRLLADARSLGIVKIRVSHPAERQRELEDGIRRRWGVNDARVITGSPGTEATIGPLSVVAADYLDSIITDDSTIAISNGRSIAATVQSLAPERPRYVTVAQMIGSVGRDNPMIDGPEIARRLAAAYNGVYRPLHAPLLAESEAARKVLVSDRAVRDTLQLAANAEVALVGIGNCGIPGPIFEGLITDEDVAGLQAANAVGHLCAQFYDASGAIVDHPVNRRSVAISMQAMTEIPTVIAVAGGAEKGHAIRAALNAGLVNTVITDAVAARVILD